MTEQERKEKFQALLEHYSLREAAVLDTYKAVIESEEGWDEELVGTIRQHLQEVRAAHMALFVVAEQLDWVPK